LIRRDLTARYAGSYGGGLWAIVNPVILCLLYGFVFSKILKIQPPQGFSGSYIEFLLGGLIPWIGLQEAVYRGATSITDQAHLVKKLPFPAELLVFSSLGAAILLQAMAVLALAGYAGASRGTFPDLRLVAVAFVFELCLLLGPVIALAALNVFFRDLSQLLGPALMVAFYLTPILYPESLVPRNWEPFLALNPLRDVVALFRSGLFGMAAPPVGRLLAWSAPGVVLAFIAGLFFRRCRRSFADLL
jgi:lipopolysaccharide transport system permease protein